MSHHERRLMKGGYPYRKLVTRVNEWLVHGACCISVVGSHVFTHDLTIAANSGFKNSVDQRQLSFSMFRMMSPTSNSYSPLT